MRRAPLRLIAVAADVNSCSETLPDAQRQAIAACAARYSVGAPLTASKPPAPKKFLVKFTRAVNSAGAPNVARKTFGRAPVAARMRSDLSRKASNGSASRNRGRDGAGTLAGLRPPGRAGRG